MIALLIVSQLEYPGIIPALQTAGIEAAVETSNSSAMRRLIEDSPCLIILSEDMPRGNEGVELFPMLRRLTDVPIIVIGTGGNEAMIEALLEGADEYFALPVNPRVLLARTRAMLRRYANSDQPANQDMPRY